MRDRDRMLASLKGLDLPTRVVTVLTYMATYRSGPDTWSDVIESYKSSPDEFEVSFLRTPGAGRKTLEALKDTLRSFIAGADHTGKVVWLTTDQIISMNSALDQACHNTSSESPDYNVLRSIQLMLSEAEVIHTKLV